MAKEQGQMGGYGAQGGGHVAQHVAVAAAGGGGGTVYSHGHGKGSGSGNYGHGKGAGSGSLSGGYTDAGVAQMQKAQLINFQQTGRTVVKISNPYPPRRNSGY